MGQDKPLTILYVDHGEGMGGAEHSLLQLMRGLDRSRFRPVLACDDGALAQAARAASLETRIAPIPQLCGRPTALLNLWRSGQVLADLARRENAQIIHSNTMRASFPAFLAAWWTGRPLIWHARDLYGVNHIGEMWYPRLMSRLARIVIANSRAVAATIPRRDTYVIYNGVELEQFNPNRDPHSARAALGLPETGPLIGTVGRMQPWKGHHLFLQAACQVRNQMPHAQFVIVGGRVFQADADYEKRLRDQAIASGLEHVRFAGQQAATAEWLSAMDVFAHCSEAEPFGRVIVEAMAAARPVVAFADGGVPEIVVRQETGLLVQPGDVDALAAAILEMARNPLRASQMGLAGRKRAESLFSAQEHVRRIETVYLSLMA
jgi:glycosyltransferase involved in cell wall biosynthesis